MENVEIRFVLTGDIEADIQRVRRAAQGLGTDSYQANKTIENSGKGAATAQDQLNTEVKETSKNLDNVGKSAEKTGSAFSQLKNMIGFAAIAAGAKALVSNIIEVRSEFEKYSAVLKNTLGSEVLARQSMNDLTEFAKKTPFALSELTESYVRLTNYGLQPSMEEMKAYGDLASSVGKDINMFSEAVADAVTGEFERLKEFGVKASKEGDKVTFTFKGQTQVVQNNSQAIKDYLVSLGQVEGVAGSMAAVSDTLGGRISNLGDSWDQLMNTLGGESSGIFATVITNLGKMVDMINNAVKSTQTLKNEAIDKATGENAQKGREEIATIAGSLQKQGMSEEAANARAVELYKKQLQEQIDEANKVYDEALAKVENAPKTFLGIKTASFKKDATALENAARNKKLLEGELESVMAVVQKETKDAKPVEVPVKPEFKYAKGSIKRLEEELKKLKDKDGTFTDPKKEAENAEKIKAKMKEIASAKLTIEWMTEEPTFLKELKTLPAEILKTQEEIDVLQKAYTEAGVTEGQKLTQMEQARLDVALKKGKAQLAASKQQLAPMKQLTAEETKQLEYASKIAELEAERAEKREAVLENLKQAGDYLLGAADLLTVMADEIETFDPQLAGALKQMAGIAGEAGSFVNSIKGGDWIGAIGSGLSLVMKLNEALKDEKKVDSIADNIAAIEEMNDVLEKQYELLLAIGEITPYEFAEKEIERISSELDAKLAELRKHRLYFKNPDRPGIVHGVKLDQMSDDQIYDFLADPNKWLRIRGLDPAEWTLQTTGGFAPIFEAINSMLESRAELLEQIQGQATDLLGFTSQDVAGTVADGIAEGLQLSEDGLGDWADTFGGLLRSMFQKELVNRLQSKYLERIMTGFQTAWEGDKKISNDELATLQTLFTNMVEGGQAMWATFQPILDQFAEAADATEDTGLTGSVKGITETTAGYIEGKLNSIQMNMIDMRDIMSEQLTALHAIEDNTSYNYHLQDIASDMAKLKNAQLSQENILKTIADNTGRSITL